MIFDIRDIQRKYDAELKENKEWSVYILPRAEVYYNSYIPPAKSPYLPRDEVLQHLVNLSFIFDNDIMDKSTLGRLFHQREFFTSIKTVDEFISLAEEAIERQEEIGFVPNAVVSTIKNPYYKYNTDDKEEKRITRRDHKRKLRILKNIEEHESTLVEIIEDYDLGQGLLTKRYLIEKSGLTRYHLTPLLKELPYLTEMYNLVRDASIQSKYYLIAKNQKDGSTN